MTETLIATTARPVTFAVTGADTVVRDIRSFPAGIEVYVTRIRRGTATIRIPGSLYRQQVTMSDLLVP